MPELPEVETVTRSIAPLVGRRIVSAEFRCVRVLRGGDPDRMAARLQGRRISAIKRYGKFIVVTLEGAGYLMIHLGMTGRLLLGGPAGKHTHAILTFDRGFLLYDDSRQFGCLEFSEEFPARVARLGPEPLEIKFEEFAARLKRHKTRVKALLLNQTFVRGVGNIYADEALFRSGIHPLAIANRLRRRAGSASLRRNGGRTHRGHRCRRLLHLGLRRCGGPEGIFSVQPSCLSTHRRTLHCVRRRHPARSGNSTVVAFLPSLPAALSFVEN